jgi:hypothetical protein
VTDPGKAQATKRPPLRLLGADVALERRLADGRAVVRYLDRHGAPTPVTAAAWPHELRGIGWHIAEIKRLVERLPLQGAAPIAPTLTPPLLLAEPRAPQPRGFLHAHFSAAED